MVEKSVSFNHDEKVALQQMVRDWLQEELVAPPFDRATAAVLQKLGLDEEEVRAAAPAGQPKTQEVLSEPQKREK